MTKNERASKARALLFFGCQGGFGAVVEVFGVPDGRVFLEQIEELLKDGLWGGGGTGRLRCVGFAGNSCAGTFTIQRGPSQSRGVVLLATSASKQIINNLAAGKSRDSTK